MSVNLIKVRKLDLAALLPQFATYGAACADLFALDAGVVPPGGAAVFRTGLAFEIPLGHAMLIYSRSGQGFKHGVRLANCVGVIDSDYRGEVMVKLTSDECSFLVNAGDRIAQAMVVPVPRFGFIQSESLSDTDRGAGGFGSTGA